MRLLKSLFIVLFITFLAAGCGSSGNLTVQTTRVSGTVLDVYGKTIAGAEVIIHSEPVTVITDNNGYFSAEVEAGDHQIVINKGPDEIYSGVFTCYENTPLSLENIATSFDPDINNTDNDGDSFTENEGDCNDEEKSIHPGATEVCGDGTDQDCNGIDEACQGITTGFWSGNVMRFNVSADSQNITQEGSLLLGQAISLGPITFPSCPRFSITVGRGSPSITIDAHGNFSLTVDDSETDWTVNGEFVSDSNSQGTYEISTVSEPCGYIQTSGSWTSAPFTPDCTDKPIADIVFEDANLRECIAFEQNFDEICSDDISSLDCPFDPISRLGGIELLTGLVDLDLSDGFFVDHNISDVSPLFFLTDLARLNLEGNDNIPCSQLYQLDSILGPGVVMHPDACSPLN